jgi:hypothetical protein
MKIQAKYIVQLRTDPAFDVIDTTTGQVVSVWNDVRAADIDAAERLVMDLRDAQRANQQRNARVYDELELWTIDQRNAQS